MLCKECLQKGIRVNLKTKENSKLECPKCKRIVDLKSAEIVRIVPGEGRRGIPPIISTGMPKALAPKRPVFRPSKYPPLVSEKKFEIYKKPREWSYITKPFFAKIKEPLVDVFKEAEEVQIIIDLGSFARGEISFGLMDGIYTIAGRHEDYEFKEEIPLLEGVDLAKVKERFKGGILELILPRKKEPSRRKKRVARAPKALPGRRKVITKKPRRAPKKKRK